jgi:hypothetical protein
MALYLCTRAGGGGAEWLLTLYCLGLGGERGWGGEQEGGFATTTLQSLSLPPFHGLPTSGEVIGEIRRVQRELVVSPPPSPL